MIRRPRWLANAAALLGAGAAAVMCALGPSTRSATGDGHSLPISEPTAPRHALLIARARDCDSRLGFAHVFERAGLDIRFEGLVILDDDDAPMTPRANLDDLQLKIVQTQVDFRRLLGRDLRFSPLLLVYDRERVLRMIIQAPMSVESADALTRWIAGGIT